MTAALQVERSGSGPHLVLLHGWAMNAAVFAPIMPLLNAHWTVHRIDLPGHGLSRDVQVAPELESWVEAVAAVAPAQATWCGWSLGGLVALAMAQRAPARVTALAMLCASPCFVRGADQPFGVSAEIFQDFARGLREDFQGTFERFLALESLGSPHASQTVHALRNAVLGRAEPNPAVLAQGLDLLETSDLRAGLPTLACRSLWIAGRRDRLVDPRAMREAAMQAPDARFEQIEHAGHAPFLTHATQVAALLATLEA